MMKTPAPNGWPDWLVHHRLKKITLRSTAGSNKATREFFYQDTDSSHAYVANKNKHLRKTLDKKQAGTVICSSEYDLDAAGNRLGRLDQDGKYDAWSYDPNQQLRAESRWSAKTPGSLVFRTEYGYDGNGNRTVMYEDGVKVPYTIGNNNEMTEAGTDDITYDFYGSTVFINSSDSYEFAYDYERHLIELYENEDLVFRAEYDGGKPPGVGWTKNALHIVHCTETNPQVRVAWVKPVPTRLGTSTSHGSPQKQSTGLGLGRLHSSLHTLTIPREWARPRNTLHPGFARGGGGMNSKNYVDKTRYRRQLGVGWPDRNNPKGEQEPM